jgi:hypothetical protein
MKIHVDTSLPGKGESFDEEPAEFDFSRYSEVVDKLSFSSKRRHTDGFCCFLPYLWRESVGKEPNRDIVLVHGYIDFFKMQKRDNEVPEQKGNFFQTALIDEKSRQKFIELQKQVPEPEPKSNPIKHKAEELKAGRDYNFTGRAYPACEDLLFIPNTDNSLVEILFSCKNYDKRSPYCADYPKNGTSWLEDRCFYEAYAEDCKLREMPTKLSSSPLKLFGFKEGIIQEHNLENFVVGQFSSQGITYFLIPSPIPPKPQFKVYRYIPR